MASVALCPRCSHESVIPHDADSSAWAECPSCRALFQIQDAATRDLDELRVVGPAANADDQHHVDRIIEAQPQDFAAQISDRALHLCSERPDDDESPVGCEDSSPVKLSSGDELGLESPPAHSAPTVVERSDELHEPVGAAETAAAGLEEWFHAAKTVPEVRSLVPDAARGGAAAEAPPDDELTGTAAIFPADRQREFAPEVPRSARRPAPWEDSEHMERLLAEIDAPPPTETPLYLRAAELPSADRLPIEAHATGDGVVQRPPQIFATPAARRPRRRSPIRTLAGVAVFGVVGLALGYYVLLAMGGSRLDFLNIARYLPRAVLPGTFTVETGSFAVPAPRRVDPAAVPAGFDAPAIADGSERDEVSNRQAQDSHSRATEPAVLEAADAAPLASADVPHVRHAPTYSADELAVALQAAAQAQPSLGAGRLEDGPDVQRAKGNSFQRLCDLGEKLTFADATSRPTYVAPLQREADQLFHHTLADARTRGEVARIVPKWLAFTDRKNNGVFFAGTVLSATRKGDVVECRIDLEGAEPVTVLLSTRLADTLDASGRPTGFIGVIVDRPAEQVTGYEGDAPHAVWVGRLVLLE